MSKRWYKRCGADFIRGTMNLTLEEKGACSLCLDLIYDQSGPIADDPRWLAGICNVSVRKWNALRARLIETGQLFAENGSLMNARAAVEIENTRLSSEKLAKIGAKGGRNRAENERLPNKINDFDQAGLKPIDKKRKEDPPKVPRDDFDAWLHGLVIDHPLNVARDTFAMRDLLDEGVTRGDIQTALAAAGKENFRPHRWAKLVGWVRNAARHRLAQRSTSTASEPMPEDTWDKAVERFKNTKYWMLPRASPPPDDPATKIPIHILEKHGYGTATA